MAGPQGPKSEAQGAERGEVLGGIFPSPRARESGGML